MAYAIEDLVKNGTTPSQLSERVEMLAYHFYHAEITPKAAHYLKLAGNKLKENYNYRDAEKNYLKAIELIEACPNHPEIDPKLILELYYDIAFLKSRSEPEIAEKYFNAILGHPESSSDPRRRARALRALSEIAKDRGNVEGAIELQTQAIEVSKAFGDLEGEIRTLKVMGNTYAIRRETIQKAIDALQRGLEEAKRLNNPILVAEFLNDKSIIHIDRNELDLAEACLSEAITTARKGSRLENVLTNSTINMGVIHYYRKNFMEALKYWEESGSIAAKLGDLKNQMISRHNVGEVLREFEKYDEALAAFQESYETACDLGYEPWQINNLVLIGYLTARKGQSEEGIRILNEVLKVSKEKKYWSYYCDALFYLGVHYQDLKNYPLAKESLQTGLAKAQELNLPQFVTRYEEAMKKLTEEIDKGGRDVSTSDLAKA